MIIDDLKCFVDEVVASIDVWPSKPEVCIPSGFSGKSPRCVDVVFLDYRIRVTMALPGDFAAFNMLAGDLEMAERNVDYEISFADESGCDPASESFKLSELESKLRNFIENR